MTIRVKVFAPALVDHSPLDEDGILTLKDGAEVRHVYDALRIPLPARLFLLCSVNYERVPQGTSLKDGDIVTFIFPLSGG